MDLHDAQRTFRHALLRPVEPYPPKMDAAQVLDLRHGNPKGNLGLPLLGPLQYHNVEERRRRAPGLVVVVAVLLLFTRFGRFVGLLRLGRLVLAVVLAERQPSFLLGRLRGAFPSKRSEWPPTASCDGFMKMARL